jgi:hypothetical protein
VDHFAAMHDQQAIVENTPVEQALAVYVPPGQSQLL